MRPRIRRARHTNHTVLLVGEGKADYCLLEVIRELYVTRGCGISLTVKEGYGFGGQRTLERAMELRIDTPYDASGVLVDIDRHWTDAERELARAQGISFFENDPCLEAFVLRIFNEKPPTTARASKTAFERRFGCEAHQNGILRKRLTRDVIDAARLTVPTLDSLLTFLRVPR